MRVVSPLAIAPELALAEGCLVGHVPHQAEADIEAAMRRRRGMSAAATSRRARSRSAAASWPKRMLRGPTRCLIGSRSSAAPALSRRPGGVLVKCLKPQQDGRHDLPTIGPSTAEHRQARRACRRRRRSRPRHPRRARRDDRGVSARRPLPPGAESSEARAWLSARSASRSSSARNRATSSARA